MKKSMLLLMLTAMTLLAGCSGGGTKYCKISGCPSEASMHSPYCYSHKCRNHSCNNSNEGSNTGYCTECLERANQ